MQSHFVVNGYFEEKCRNFAVRSAESQRENRSGGSYQRNLEQIAEDTYRGKVGEMVVELFFANDPFNYSLNLDFNIYERGKWDESDFIIGGKKFSIKASKHFAKWLLLEKKDIERGDIYDYYIFVTIDPPNTDGRLMGGTIWGYASLNDILYDEHTLKLPRGEKIPGTSTTLDASNFARHKSFLKNSLADWSEIIRLCEKEV